jgi:hypothetical protein
MKPKLSLQAMPADAAAGSAQKQHEAMGFHDGWGEGPGPAVAVAKRL